MRDLRRSRPAKTGARPDPRLSDSLIRVTSGWSNDNLDSRSKSKILGLPIVRAVGRRRINPIKNIDNNDDD
jgi:hypothetical protein